MNDGGPAFPTDITRMAGFEGTKNRTGMTLLDWFAGQAMIAFASSLSLTKCKNNADFAEACYEMARTLIEEKNRVTAQASPAAHPSLLEPGCPADAVGE